MYDLSHHYRGPPTQLRAPQRQQRHRGFVGSRPTHMLQPEEDEEDKIARQMHQQGIATQPQRRRRVRQQTREGPSRSDGYFYSSFTDEEGRTFVLFDKTTFIVMMLAFGAGVGMLGVDARKLVHFIIKTITTFIRSVFN